MSEFAIAGGAMVQFRRSASTTLKAHALAGAAIALALIAAFSFKYLLIAPPRPSPDATGFDHARAIDRLATVLGDERPHPVDSDANDAVRTRIVRLLTEMGFAPEVRDDFACRLAPRWRTVACARVRNIVAVAGPRRGRAVMLAAHYDSVAAGPGASDDGAGVAVILEIAQLLADRPPSRPVLFLITDGEEQGLLGAESFMRTDPYAKRIDAVVNLEARGVRGPATMFETSAPNGADIATFAEVARGRGNSLATDIYRMMPNDTDASEFRNGVADILNYAYTDGFAFYHTPRDTIAAMDRASLAHLGASALQSVEAFLVAGPRGQEREVAFTDVAGAFTIAAPRWVGLFCLIGGFGAAVLVFFQHATTRTTAIFAGLAPVAAVAGAVALSFVIYALLAAVRTERLFYFANPQQLSNAYACAAIAAAAGALALLARKAAPAQRLAAVWATFCAVGLAAFALAPGSAGLFAPPAALLAAAVATSLGEWRVLRWASLPAAGLAALLVLPTLHLAEINLGLGSAWAFAGLSALLALMAFATVPTVRAGGALVVASAFIATAIAQASLSPAFDSQAPQPINIEHIVDAETGRSAVTLASVDPPPPALAAAGAFEPTAMGGFALRPGIAAPPHDGRPVGVATRVINAGEGRRITIQLQANGANEIVVIAPAQAQVRALTIGDRRFVFSGEGRAVARCIGRQCNAFEVTAEAGLKPASWRIIGVRYGLGPEANAIAAARPLESTPIQAGDVRIVESRREL